VPSKVALKQPEHGRGEMLGSADSLLFEGFCLDRGGLHRLDRGGNVTPAPLGSRALDLLGLLVERQGELISKDEIMQAVWPQTMVEENNLTVQISALRRILDRDRVDGSCIQTVPGRGYRFVPAVRRAEKRSNIRQTTTAPGLERRLVAVLAADVADYFRLMSTDEEGTIERLKTLRAELVDLKIAEHRGRIAKTSGDGFLAEFSTAVDAVRCAIELQAAIAEHNSDVPVGQRIEFRIGVNVGDIIVEPGDILGDSVNIVARLQALARPGEICISARVHEDVAGRLDIAFDDLGEQQLRNISRPLRVYRVGVGLGDWPLLPLPDRPSIAVLAFVNMSGDPRQDFFAEGIADDIITALSKLRFLFVIARNSSFAFKGRSIGVKDIGRELGVRYILEGSVRQAGDRVRVTAQLIEAATGVHLWSEHYDRNLTDLFAVQDDITASVALAIRPAIEHRERERAARKPPESLDAWECYQRGMHHFWYQDVDLAQTLKARSFFQRAAELDPQFVRAHGMLSATYIREAVNFRPDLRPENVPRAIECSRRAVAIDPTDAMAHATLAIALTTAGRHAEGIAEADVAAGLDPNCYEARFAQGYTRVPAGRARDAIEPLRIALRLNPFGSPFHLANMARAHYLAGEYEAAVAVAQQARRSTPNFPAPHVTLMAALGQLGRAEEARAVLAEALERFGDRIRFYMSPPPNVVRERRPEDTEHLLDGLRKAGIAEYQRTEESHGCSGTSVPGQPVVRSTA
jgi:adenylate cyclase